jgi:lysophospholipase L1-like esterase
MRVAPIVVAAALCVGVIAPTSQASSAVSAVGTWSIEPQSRDRGGDGFIDGDGGVPSSGALSADPAATYVGAGNGIAQPNERLINGVLSWYLPTSGLAVRLASCESRGRTYFWTIRTGNTEVIRTPERQLTKKKCRTTVTLPEGQYMLTLTVRGAGRTARTNIPAQVRNTVIVSLGDSYASGEGNPRNVDAWLRARSPFAAFRPYWDNDVCRRSTRAAPAQAALQLEQSDPRSAVTFIHLACSGATIQRGVLGSQAPGIPAQIDAMQQLLASTRVDAIMLSIGGNDIGFGTLLQTCLLNTNCPLVRATSGPLASYPTIQEGVQQRLAQLRIDFLALRDRLAVVAPNTPVFITMYPDITRNADGAPCSYFGMPPSDFSWARETILVPDPPASYTYTTTQGTPVNFPLPNGTLNSQIAQTQDFGWRPVRGTWTASGTSTVGHGICAGQQSWVIGINLNGNTNGAFHPNPAGQQAMADALFAVLQRR